MRIAKNINNVTDIIPNNVKLVAVSKTKSINLIESAYKAGQRDFGENKVQELVNKFENLPKDINWKEYAIHTPATALFLFLAAPFLYAAFNSLTVPDLDSPDTVDDVYTKSSRTRMSSKEGPSTR